MLAALVVKTLHSIPALNFGGAGQTGGALMLRLFSSP
jgi:hypothetical protein